MFTKIVTYSEPVFDSDDFMQTVHKYKDFETANNAGMHDACINIVSHVKIVNDRGQLVASWSEKGNRWIVFQDKKGRFVTPSKYFEQRRIETERFCCGKGYNVRIRGNEFWMKLHAGTQVVKFRPSLLPLLEDMCESLWLESIPFADGERAIVKTEKEKLESLGTGFALFIDKL